MTAIIKRPGAKSRPQGAETGNEMNQHKAVTPEPEKDPLLAEAMQELAEIPQDAEELGTSVSETTLSNAGILLRRLYDKVPRRYMISCFGEPDQPEDSVAIDARGENGGIVVITCDPDERVLCIVSNNEERNTVRYPSIEGLPDEYIANALRSLGKERITPGSGQIGE